MRDAAKNFCFASKLLAQVYINALTSNCVIIKSWLLPELNIFREIFFLILKFFRTAA